MSCPSYLYELIWQHISEVQTSHSTSSLSHLSLSSNSPVSPTSFSIYTHHFSENAPHTPRTTHTVLTSKLNQSWNTPFLCHRKKNSRFMGRWENSSRKKDTPHRGSIIPLERIFISSSSMQLNYLQMFFWSICFEVWGAPGRDMYL